MRRMISAAAVAALAGALIVGAASTAGAARAAKTSACPRGTRANEGSCIETKLRPDPLSWRDANRFCLDAHRRLPSLAELQTLFDRTGSTATAPEWHNLRYRAGSDELAGVVTGDGEVDTVTATSPQVYRCVVAR
jgi:hypothetical protein